MIDQDIAKALLHVGAVKVQPDQPFTWTSGIVSPIYCDNRMMIAFPRHRTVIVDGFMRLITEKKLEFDVIGGTATAAIPWAAFLAYALDKPMIYIRPEPKGHGAGKQIEGYLEPGKRVLIIEDLISTGGSSVKAAEVVRNEGRCTVSDVVAIVTYEFPESSEKFQAAGLNLYTLTGFSALMAEAQIAGTLTAEQFQAVMGFKDNPRAWWQGFR